MSGDYRQVREGLVLWFEEVGRQDVRLVGGKCANLGEMLRAGISIPPGFAVSTEAFQRFIDESHALNEVSQHIRRLLEEPEDAGHYEATSRLVRQVVESKALPRAVGQAVNSAYDLLSRRCGVADLAVAVRSSGVAEDLATASFAGQHDSYLNVIGEQELLEKIIMCWSSLFTARALAYRVKKGLGLESMSISVAVQKCVNARSAGVAFTAHPVTGDPSKIVIEGNWGLAVTVVDGTVEPDSYEIAKDSLTVEKRRIGHKTTEVLPGPGQGTEEKEVPAPRQDVPCLTEAETQRLAELAKAIESYYGAAQDIEWAIDQDLPFPENVLIVQSRPITTPVRQAQNPTEFIIDSILKKVFKL